MADLNPTPLAERSKSAAATPPLTSSTDAQLRMMLSTLTQLADAIQAQADAVLAGSRDSGLIVGMHALAGQAGWIADSASQLLGETGFKVTPAEWMMPGAVAG